TLLEGGVRVQTPGYPDNEVTASQRSPAGAGQKTAVLKPGQQAQITYTTAGGGTGLPMNRQNTASLPTLKVVDNADIDKVMAWKNGTFNFQDASLVEVMRQLERWYDIQVVYEKGIPNIHFVGEMSRDIS